MLRGDTLVEEVRAPENEANRDQDAGGNGTSLEERALFGLEEDLVRRRRVGVLGLVNEHPAHKADDSQEQGDGQEQPLPETPGPLAQEKNNGVHPVLVLLGSHDPSELVRRRRCAPFRSDVELDVATAHVGGNLPGG